MNKCRQKKNKIIMYNTSVRLIIYLPYKTGRKVNYIYPSPGEEGKQPYCLP